MEDREYAASGEDTTEEETAAGGAAALPPLPAPLLVLEKTHRDAITTWAQAVHRLKMAMRKAEDQGAGPSGLPDPRDPSEVAQELGLPWPRTGTDQFKVCEACKKGGCKRQKLPTPCTGCTNKQACEALICLVPYRPGQPSMVPFSSTATLTADTLGARQGALRRAGEADRAAFHALTDALASTGF